MTSPIFCWKEISTRITAAGYLCQNAKDKSSEHLNLSLEE